MKRAWLAVLAGVLCLQAVGCCCYRPCRPLLWWWPGRCLGCSGPCYWGDYFEGRDCCDPCDGCGNWCGGGCGYAGWQSAPTMHGGCPDCQRGFEQAQYAPGYYPAYEAAGATEMEVQGTLQPTPVSPRQSTRPSHPVRPATRRTMH